MSFDTDKGLHWLGVLTETWALNAEFYLLKQPSFEGVNFEGVYWYSISIDFLGSLSIFLSNWLRIKCLEKN